MSALLCDRILAFTADREGGPYGVYRSAVDALAIIRADLRTPLQHVLYDPALIVVVQGAKDVMLGGAHFAYRAGQYLALGVGLPVLARITEASAAAPYLALALTIDRAILGDLIRDIDSAPFAAPASERGLFVGTLSPAQRDGIERIAALLDDPAALRILYPSIVREVFYWLLRGPDGDAFRHLATPESNAQRIADAIGAIRAHLTETLRVEQLATIANMSPSSFHAHFKAVTSMSPLQYQKQLRLLEARRIMLAGGADATRAAYHVGYESASQFSREYTRMFGAPPHRDVSGLRASVA